LLSNATGKKTSSDNATLNSGKERFCDSPGKTMISMYSFHRLFFHEKNKAGKNKAVNKDTFL
jgi:hypothetical protein